MQIPKIPYRTVRDISKLLIRTVVINVFIVYVDWLGPVELEACSHYASYARTDQHHACLTNQSN